MNNISPFKFESKPIRVLRVDGQPMMAVVDIADVISVSRRMLTQIITRNADVFEGIWRNVTFPQVGIMRGKPYAQKREMVMVNHDGLIGLLLTVTSSRIKDPEARRKVVAFKRWSIRTLRKVLDGSFDMESDGPGLEFSVDGLDQVLFGLPLRMAPEAMKQLGDQFGVSPKRVYSYIQARRVELGLTPSRRRRRKGASGRLDVPETPLHILIKNNQARKAIREKYGFNPTAENKQSFGVKLKRARECKGFSMRGLNRLCSVSAPTISLYERGRLAPREDYLLAICEQLEVTPEYLLGVNVN